MDDVAGIRMIFPDTASLEAFRADFHTARFKHRRRNTDDQYNYIARPKVDGYRGIHDVYAYQVTSKHAQVALGLYIEIQYRTLVQHAWATANEVVGYITGNETKFGRGDPRYMRIMALTSEILARAHEATTGPLPDLSDLDLASEFVNLDTELGLSDELGSMQGADVRQLSGKQNHVLIFMRNGELQVKDFTKNASAMKWLFRYERENPESNAVLVGGDTPDQVEITFRNYFKDTSEYLKLLIDGVRTLGIKIGAKFEDADVSASNP